MVPYDVLIDPLSLPSHPVVAEKQNMHQIIHEDIMKEDTQGVGSLHQCDSHKALLALYFSAHEIIHHRFRQTKKICVKLSIFSCP